MDPKYAKLNRAKAQADTRRMVEKLVTPLVKGRGPQSEAEWAFVRAIYNPDRRLG